jgi:hypothetical protein
LDPVPEPSAEGRGLIGVAEPEQRVHGEGGVAYPGEAVVPVALAAHLFGEGGRRAGIIAVPTVIASIYGMNFRYMPELYWRLGYPLVVLVMVASCVVLYAVFKRSG